MPIFDQQVQIVFIDSPDRNISEIFNKIRVLRNAKRIILLGLDYHFPIDALIIVIFNKYIILESVPIHEEIAIAASSLYPYVFIRFEFYCEIVVDVVVGNL